MLVAGNIVFVVLWEDGSSHTRLVGVADAFESATHLAYQFEQDRVKEYTNLSVDPRILEVAAWQPIKRSYDGWKYGPYRIRPRETATFHTAPSATLAEAILSGWEVAIKAPPIPSNLRVVAVVESAHPHFGKITNNLTVDHYNRRIEYKEVQNVINTALATLGRELLTFSKQLSVLPVGKHLVVKE